MIINFESDVTTRELIADLAWMIYRDAMGYAAPAPTENLMYFFDSQHPSEKSCLYAAENIFEMMTGDRPDYSDEDGEE